jgi:hypothetical protein
MQLNKTKMELAQILHGAAAHFHQLSIAKSKVAIS